MHPAAAAAAAAGVKLRAYRFDGAGGFAPQEWDLAVGGSAAFTWFHVELPRSSALLLHAQSLIEALCPPLTLQDILALASNGPFCGHVADGALVFRLSSPAPAGSSSFAPLRLAARISERSLITVSVGRVPRLGFAPPGHSSLLYDIPSVRASSDSGVGSVVIADHVLEDLLMLKHSEDADNPVPRTVSNLLVHIVDTHVDHLYDIVTKLEMELDAVELELDKGGYLLKKQMLDDRRIPKMHLDLQRLLQVVSHGEQVFPRVKEKCATKTWFLNEDIVALEELIGRLRRLKENLGFITNRVTALQASLDSWQAEQINRKLYYLSFLSMIFLPLSIVTGIFGMNVGGVPWTSQNEPEIKDGFINVMILCAVMLLLLLLCFVLPSISVHFSAWRARWVPKRSSSINRKPSSRRSHPNASHRGGYFRL